MKYIIISLLFLQSFFSFANVLSAQTIKEVREIYLKAAFDEDLHPKAFKMIKAFMQKDSTTHGVAITYAGSLKMSKARFTMWPHTQISLVKKGLKIIDHGLKKDSTNLESIFIHASSCYFLPFFFNRGDKAEENLKLVVESLESESAQQYDPEWIVAAMSFMLEKIDLGENYSIRIQAILNKFSPMVKQEQADIKN